MVVIVENNDYLDLEMPVYMSEEQLEKFLYLIRREFGDVAVSKVEEPSGHKISGGTAEK